MAIVLEVNNLISKQQQRAKDFASKYGYTLRKIKEGNVKITRSDGSQIVVSDFDAAWYLMMEESYVNGSKKNIFER